MADKVFRDPLYNYIAFDRDHDSWLLELLDTPEVQRLRRIHQLGVSYLTYPGADHNRLAHSLGVAHLMQFVLSNLEKNQDSAAIDTARQALLATALLHDVGHGPFSHLFEPCLGTHHEDWSIAVVLDSNTEVNKILKKQDPYLPNRVADLINSEDVKHPAWQRALMSSQLDVDRLDYLRRDSLCTGSGYGHFDWHRLLSTVQLYEGNHSGGSDLVWPEKAALAIEEYVFARYYMYQNVYLHKTTRGFEQLLIAMWNRAIKLKSQGDDLDICPALMNDVFWIKREENLKPSESLTVSDYLRIEEFTVLEQIQRWSLHKDGPLSDCAKRFLYRKGLAMITPPKPSNPLLERDFGHWECRLKELLQSKGYDPDTYCLADRVKAKYLQPYREEKERDQQNAVNTIRVIVDGQPVAVGEYLPRLRSVISPSIDRVNYYVPKEIKAEAVALSKELNRSD